MRTISFFAGHTVYEIGSASDVILFFDCLNNLVTKKHPERDWTLLTDRLYRRYIPCESSTVALDLMKRAKEVFASLPSAAVNWGDIANCAASTRLNPNQPTLADVFAKYFEHYVSANASAKSFLDAFNINQPIRIVRADIAGFMADKKRSLADYDNLVGKPYWLRE